ncbi:uncharacterized protein LOC124276857 [Haliotis rubra]|uniref:uncharacterized protein LOC124276857 n=1 Tax=Haliotis rubra TaxID=36100 RepID=UPI001EE6160A|nr:uncharacterized protein LOC124276857 [Haliotis rubra]
MAAPPESSFLALIEAVLSLAAPPMPRPKRSTHPIKAGGYPEDIFINLTEEDKEEFECSICYQILKDTMLCSNKHKYCHSCIYVWSTSGVHLNRTRCPVCRTNGFYSRDTELDNKIKAKEVKCSMAGCSWTGKLMYLLSHKHTNYDSNSNPSPVENVDTELPQLRRRNTPRTQSISRTGLQFPTRHLHLRSSLPSNSLNRGLNNIRSLSDSNNNTLSRDSFLSRDTSDGIVHTPRPPSTPRPPQQVVRRVPTLPSLLQQDSPRPNVHNSNISTPSYPVQPSEVSTRTLIQPSARTQVSNSLSQIRDRLHDSRSRLDSLMTTFGTELEQRQQEVFDVNAERERHRQEQLQEVRELGRRLGQVASELRRLLNQRSAIRGEINDLMEN